ncbi:hypothetical protein [Methylomonas koyamae]|uniref:hypothetical protein n=1 Tax=Methylomonas koyamae TaxID=702114 RepID=UPI00112DCC2E|nr:hypothetical protein [Methylomonas koyamae]TPQ24946.1 hypothetical protein C2U68_17370 [Methylomonas koyamae]
MTVFGMKIKIDWRQKSTIRGAILAFFSAVALVGYIITGDPAFPGVVTAIGTSLAGNLGLLVKD